MAASRPGLRPGCVGSRFWKRRRGGESEADEQRGRLNGDADVAFKPRKASVLLVEPFRDRRLAPLVCIR